MAESKQEQLLIGAVHGKKLPAFHYLQASALHVWMLKWWQLQSTRQHYRTIVWAYYKVHTTSNSAVNMRTITKRLLTAETEYLIS